MKSRKIILILMGRNSSINDKSRKIKNALCS